jgi:phage gp37-like protein
MIVAYREAVVSRIRTSLPGLREVASHGGVFSLDEAKRRITNSPSVYVAVLGVKPGDHAPTGEITGRAEVAAYVFARNQGALAAETQAWAIAVDVVRAISGVHIVNGSMLACDIEVENLWSGELDRNGACIVAVVWSTEVVLGTDWLTQDLLITETVVEEVGDVQANETASPTGVTLP